MQLFLWALALLCAGAILAFLFSRWPAVSTFFGVAAATVGGTVGFVSAMRVFFRRGNETLALPWAVPYGSFSLGLDALSAVFLLPIFALSAIAAVYGAQYLWSWRKRKNLGVSWMFYNLLTVGMAMVVTARNGMLFLVVWEVMTITSFFLVTFEDEKEQVSRAGWIYLVAAHIGTAFLIAMFVLLGKQSGSLDFAAMTVTDPNLANIIFLLALVGFGVKAGFMPLHVWLPEAHPAAPSHVSAIMSGVMIKTGIYGLLRIITILGVPAQWWGWALLAIGMTSGVLGVLFALAQHDLKRLLAYHSVENIGIITLGLGIGLLGVHSGNVLIAAAGLCGGLLHMLNHAVFKSLLFLGAGAVRHSCQTLEIDHLGGLLKRMPVTGVFFLIGSAAISGLPPLNGFMSEFCIYFASFVAVLGAGQYGGGVAALASLALIGGLAAACFTKAFGIVFLGEPRSEHAQHAHEVGWGMRFSMGLLAILCIGLAIASPKIVLSMQPVIGQISGIQESLIGEQLISLSTILGRIIFVLLLFAGLIGIVWLWRMWMLCGQRRTSGPTWDCGYAAPTARMQYTASSFAQPIVRLFRVFLRSRNKYFPAEGLFPQRGTFHTDTPDAGHRYMYMPLYKWMTQTASRFHWLQSGRLQVYVLYIALTLWILLIWKLK